MGTGGSVGARVQLSPGLVPARSPSRRRAAPFARGVPPAPAFPAPVSFRACIKLSVPLLRCHERFSFVSNNKKFILIWFYFLRFHIDFQQLPSLRAAALPPPF